jgi:hypothetical protein
MDKYSSAELALIRRRVTFVFATGAIFLVVGLAVCLHLFRQETRLQPVPNSTFVDQSDGGGGLVDEEASNDEAPSYSMPPNLLAEKQNIQPRARPSLGPATIEASGPPSAFPTQAPSQSPAKVSSWRPSVFPGPPSAFPTQAPSQSPSAFSSTAPSQSPIKIPSWRPSVFPTVVPSLIPSYRPSFTEPSILPSWRPSHVSYFPGNLTREQSKYKHCYI